MAHPKRQHSKQRQRKRRTHDGIAQIFGSLTPEGSTSGFNHRVCQVTGYYKGRQVIDISSE